MKFTKEMSYKVRWFGYDIIKFDNVANLLLNLQNRRKLDVSTWLKWMQHNEVHIVCTFQLSGLVLEFFKISLACVV